MTTNDNDIIFDNRYESNKFNQKDNARESVRINNEDEKEANEEVIVKTKKK